MKLQRTILLRVDASEKLGLGHLMRCVALAQGLKKESIHPVFIMKDYKKDCLIAEYGFDFRLIPQEISFKEDALKTMEIAAQYHTRVIIVDLSHESNIADGVNFREYFMMLKEYGAVTIVLDDYEKVDFAADIHVIPYYGAEVMNYSFPIGTRPLIGLDYCIFRDEFLDYTNRRRTIITMARNVLITMGGSDPSNVTTQIVDSLEKNKSMSLNVKVVLGKGFACSRKESVLDQIRKFNRGGGQCHIVENVRNMAELMSWSDVVITGGGLIKHEAALTGSPNIIISQEQKEARRCDEYARTNVAIHLGHYRDFKKDISAAIFDLLSDCETRKTMSDKGKQLVDGKGTQRIVKHILEMETSLV